MILCERGIKTFEDSMRYTLDVTSIPVAQAVVASADDRRSEPCRGQARLCSGDRRWREWRRERMGSSSRFIIAPAEAQCDGPQALLPETFRELMVQLRKIAAIFEQRIRRGTRRCG